MVSGFVSLCMQTCCHQIDGPSDGANDSQAGGATNEGGAGAGQAQPASLSTISFNAADEARQQEQRSSGEEEACTLHCHSYNAALHLPWMPSMVFWVSLSVVALQMPTCGRLLTKRGSCIAGLEQQHPMAEAHDTPADEAWWFFCRAWAARSMGEARDSPADTTALPNIPVKPQYS